VKYQAEIDTIRATHPDGYNVSCEPQVGEMLYALVRLCQPVVAVEIGCFLGFSTYHILSALAANGTGKLYAIEGRDFQQTFRDKPECVFMLGDSHQLVPTLPPVDFAFVDGDHSYVGLSMDIAALMPKLRIGSVVVFHDTESYDGTLKAVAELPKVFEKVTLPTPIVPERALWEGKPSGITIVRKVA